MKPFPRLSAGPPFHCGIPMAIGTAYFRDSRLYATKGSVKRYPSGLITDNSYRLLLTAYRLPFLLRSPFVENIGLAAEGVVFPGDMDGPYGYLHRGVF